MVAVSCGFCTVHQLVCLCCVGQAHSHLPANNLNKRGMHVSKITAAAPGSIRFKCRGEVGEGMSSATEEISADDANAWHSSHWASDNLSCSQAKVCSF